MTITVEAVYEDGVLKPAQRLPFAEHQQVQLTVAAASPPANEGDDIVKKSYGLIGWQGTHEEFQRMMDELDEGLS